MKANHTLDSQRLKVEYLIDNSPVAEPMSIRFCAMMRLRSLYSEHQCVSHSPRRAFAFFNTSKEAAKVCLSRWTHVADLICQSLCSISFVNTTAAKSSSSQLRAMSKTARDLVLPAPNTPAMQRSERPVRMARRSAMATAKT